MFCNVEEGEGCQGSEVEHQQVVAIVCVSDASNDFWIGVSHDDF